MKVIYLLNQAAKLVGVPSYKISYAISQGYLEEPVTPRVNNHRCFTDPEIEKMKRYFADLKANKEAHAK